MPTTQKPCNDLTSLNPQDRALLELLQAERYNIHDLLNKQNPLHPAQTSILDLLDWVSQPHIEAAIQHVMQLHEALSANADKEAHLIAKKSLSHALAIAASMIPHFDACPADPEQAELFARHSETLIRETRLIARTLLKLSPPLSPPRRSRATSSDDADTNPDIASEIESSPAPHAEYAAARGTDDGTPSDSAAPDSIHSVGSRASRTKIASRLNRNSRKPAFSPAEVAEILSALLDHEADLSSRASSSRVSSTPTDPAPVAPSTQ